jgi:glycosyltransferase involved in cell wall biosynthesis
MALRAYAALDRWALSLFARIGVVSEEVGRLLERAGVKQDRIVRIPNGIDARKFSAAQPASDLRLNCTGEIVVGMVSRLVREKGGEVLLRAIAEVAEEFATVRLIFVGEGPERDFLEERATKLGIGPAVVFAGRRSDMPEVYAAFDICVLPSFGEGMPMTVLEAMAAGRAMIATRVGEIPQVITDGENGLLVEPKDPGGLRDAIHKLLCDTELRQKLAKNGSSHIHNNFSFERMTQAYLEIYGEVAKTTPGKMQTVGVSNHPRPQSKHA